MSRRDVFMAQSAAVAQQISASPQTGGVVLHDTGRHQIQVIRAIREATGLSLAEAKALSDATPSRIPVASDRASALREALTAAGATASPAGPPPAPTAAEASAPSDEADPIEQLERLAALRDSGAIDEHEFDKLKSDLLSGE